MKISLLLGGVLLCFAISTQATVIITPLHHKKATFLSSYQMASGQQQLLASSASNIRKIREVIDPNGIVHRRYRQYYNNIPIYGYQVLTHSRASSDGLQGNITKLSGILVENMHSATTLTKQAVADDNGDNIQEVLNQQKLKFAHDNNVALDALSFRNEHAELVYYIDKQSMQPILAYSVNFYVDGQQVEPSKPYYLINANTKELIAEHDGLARLNASDLGKFTEFYKRLGLIPVAKGMGPGGNLITGYYEYGETQPKFKISYISSLEMCRLSTRYFRTINLNGHYYKEPNPHMFTCFTQGGDEINGGYSPLNDAHYFSSINFAMYKDWYGLSGIFPKKVNIFAHYKVNHEGAFWSYNSVFLGDGGEDVYPLTTLDTLAHEIAHGVTERFSGLQYWGQSGAINESFSDMAAQAAEEYLRGYSTWQIGNEIHKNLEPFRYMYNPPQDGNSIDHVDNYNEDLDVHFASGIFNKAFYLMSSNGLGVRKAFALMLYANQNYWYPASTFRYAAEGVCNAALDLGYGLDATKDAFAAVGITLKSNNNTCYSRDSILEIDHWESRDHWYGG